MKMAKSNTNVSGREKVLLNVKYTIKANKCAKNVGISNACKLGWKEI